MNLFLIFDLFTVNRKASKKKKKKKEDEIN